MKQEQIETNSKRWFELKNLLNEEWKNIKGWENLYLISNYGRIKSLPKRKNLKNGYYFTTNEKILSCVYNKYRGYYAVELKTNNKKQKFYIHRLVAMHYIDNPLNKKEVNHIDMNRKNFNINNLEWCNHYENMHHSIKNGNFIRTEQWKNNLHKSQEKTYKKVVGININDNTDIKIYEKLNGVSKDGFRPGDVCRCCKNQRNMAGGYYWYYYDDIKINKLIKEME